VTHEANRARSKWARWAHGRGFATMLCAAPRDPLVWRPWHVFTVWASGIGVYSISRAAMPARASGEAGARLPWRSTAGRKPSQHSTPHRMFPPGGCMMRRTFVTVLRRLGVRLEVIEAVLNHLSGSRAGRNRNISMARLGRGETRSTRRRVGAPSRRGRRQAACSKDVAQSAERGQARCSRRQSPLQIAGGN
jgi:hypothetical protein